MLNKLKKRSEIDKIIFVADSGIFCRKTLLKLEQNGFSDIVGARIKNLKQDVTQQILEQKTYQKIGKSEEGITGKRILVSQGYKGIQRTLLITQSTKRAKKEAFEREKNINKLLRKIESKEILKKAISNSEIAACFWRIRLEFSQPQPS